MNQNECMCSPKALKVEQDYRHLIDDYCGWTLDIFNYPSSKIIEDVIP